MSAFPRVIYRIYTIQKKKKILVGFFVGMYRLLLGFPGGSVGKNPPANIGNKGSIPGSRRFPREGNGNPLQYSLPGKSYEYRSLVGYNSWGHKEPDTT